MSTKPYRLTQGKHHHDGVVHTAGDTVYLTDTQYLAFQDRFLAEEIYHQNTELDAAIRKAQEDAKQAVLDAHNAKQEAIKQKAADDAKKTVVQKAQETAQVKAAAEKVKPVVETPQQVLAPQQKA